MARDECNNCEASQCWNEKICAKCNGQGSIIDFTVGLGPHGLLPSYAEIPCPMCHGQGYRRIYCDYYQS